jgi:hypothetical protein
VQQAAQFVEALDHRGFDDHELVTVNGNRVVAARKGPANAIELSIELTAPQNHRAIWELLWVCREQLRALLSCDVPLRI